MIEYKGWMIPEIMPEVVISMTNGMTTPEVVIFDTSDKNKLVLPLTAKEISKPLFDMRTLITIAKREIDNRALSVKR